MMATVAAACRARAESPAGRPFIIWWGLARCRSKIGGWLWGTIRHQLQGPPAGIFPRERWLVMVLWISSSQGAREDKEDSHADFRIIAEGFHQNDRRGRRRDLRQRRGCQSPGLQASGTEEIDTGRRSVSRPAEGQRKLRCLPVLPISQELRRGRGRDQRDRLVPHVYDVFPARSRRAYLANFTASQTELPPPQAGEGVLGPTIRYRVSGSIWTILLVCWPSVHMLERTLGSELFCTSIWRVLMEVGRR